MTADRPNIYCQPIDPRCPIWRDFLRHLGPELKWIQQGDGYLPDLHVIAAIDEDEDRVIGHISMVEKWLTLPTRPATPIHSHGIQLSEMFVMTFRVEAPFRGLGLGKDLQGEAMQLARERLCYQLRSWSSEGAAGNYSIKIGLGFGIHPSLHPVPGEGEDLPGVYFVLPTGVWPGEPKLPNHRIILDGDTVRMRPIREDDWSTLLRWYEDPDVMWWNTPDDVTRYSLETVQHVFRYLSTSGYAFLLEQPAGRPVGWLCLQRMNAPRRMIFGKKVLRLSVGIGESQLWGKGIGKEAAGVALRYAFQEMEADVVGAVGVSSANRRAANFFRGLGFTAVASYEMPESKYGADTVEFDFALDRTRWKSLEADGQAV